MLAEFLDPESLDRVVHAAVALSQGAATDALPEDQQYTLDRARALIADPACGQRPVVALLPSRPAARVWVLRRWDRAVDEVSLHTSEDGAFAELGEYVRGCWDNVGRHDDVPSRPPGDDREAAEHYYLTSGDNADEGYRIYLTDVAGPRRTRIVSLDYHFPGAAECEQLNRAAVFYPQDDRDDTLPCIEVGGVQVYVYLDTTLRAVRVSVDLEGTARCLARPDYHRTVGLRVEVGERVVLDDSDVGAPPSSTLDALLRAATESQRPAILALARAAGVLWQCPDCRWDNPREATCCEGPSGPCREPKPHPA